MSDDIPRPNTSSRPNTRDEVLRRAAESDDPNAAIAILEAARAGGHAKEPAILLALSRALEVAGRLRDGVVVCQELLGAHPTLAAGWARLGGLFMAASVFDKAEQALDRALDLDPKDPDILLAKADLMTFSGRLEEARVILERLRESASKPMRPTPQRSIVIPVLRNEPGGKHDVAALLEDLADFEGEVVAVFNDDAAWQALKDHPRLTRHTFNSDNVGVGRAWNIGLNLVEGAVVHILNSDLRIDDLSCLSALEACLLEEPEVAIAGVAGELIDPDTLNPTRTITPGSFTGRLTADSVQGHFFTLHAERWAEAGLSFDPRLAPFFCEEIDIGRQARRAGLGVRVVETSGWRHAIGISRADYPVRYLGQPVDRNVALLENRLRLREKWRRNAAEPVRAPSPSPSPEPSGIPETPSQQSAADRAEDHYYLYSRPEVRALVPKSARRVLDIGCGAGALGAELKKDLGCEVWGVEFQEDVAEQARARLDTVFSGDVFRLRDKIPAGGFDTVILADVLEHVIDGDGLLGIVKEALAPGGRLVLSLPNISHWSIVVGLMQGQWEYTDEGLLDRTHLRFFTPASARAMLSRNGFTPEVATGKSIPGIEPPEGFVEALAGFDLDVRNLPATASVYQMLFVCRVG